MAFIGSPELVTALAFSGRLDFNPATDSLADPKGTKFMFTEPTGDELPKAGYVFSREGLLTPPATVEERRKVPTGISPTSDRLAELQPFAAWDGKDMPDLLVLMKAKGKCTTDHISQAGPWLKYRGHLANISNNMFLGAINAFTGEAGKGKNVLTGEGNLAYPEVAKQYKSAPVRGGL